MTVIQIYENEPQAQKMIGIITKRQKTKAYKEQKPSQKCTLEWSWQLAVKNNETKIKRILRLESTINT